jgi:hypothetical protein
MASMKILIIMSMLLMTINLEAKCRDLNKSLDAGTHSISKVLDCPNTKVIREDIRETIQVTNLCGMHWTIKPKTACKVLGKYTALLVVNEIPKDWGCIEPVSEEEAMGIAKAVIDTCLDHI